MLPVHRKYGPTGESYMEYNAVHRKYGPKGESYTEYNTVHREVWTKGRILYRVQCC